MCVFTFSAGAIEKVSEADDHHEDDCDYMEGHHRAALEDLPRYGSIRPAYSTASHAAMDATAIALSARLASKLSPPSVRQALPKCF